MLVDSLVFVGENRFGSTLMLDSALKEADRLGIQRLIAAPARPNDYRLEPANEALAAQSRDTERVWALGRIDPWGGALAVEEARRCVEDLGCVGLFLHPAEEACPVTRAGAIFDFASSKEVPIVVATGYPNLSEPLQVGAVSRQYPNARIIMTNGGQINISGLSMVDAQLALGEHANLYVMTNGEYRQDFIEELSVRLPERTLWCSMAPWFDQTFELQRIRSVQMSERARRSIEGENALEVFGFAGS